MRKRELTAELTARLEAANQTIELLRAKLCGDDHEYVKVGESVLNAGNHVEIETVFVCTRCGKRKVGRW